MTPTEFIAFMQGFISSGSNAPTPAQWAAIKAKMAEVAENRAPDWYEPPFAAPRVIIDGLPDLLPWTAPPPVTC